MTVVELAAFLNVTFYVQHTTLKLVSENSQSVMYDVLCIYIYIYIHITD